MDHSVSNEVSTALVAKVLVSNRSLGQPMVGAEYMIAELVIQVKTKGSLTSVYHFGVQFSMPLYPTCMF